MDEKMEISNPKHGIIEHLSTFAYQRCLDTALISCMAEKKIRQ